MLLLLSIILSIAYLVMLLYLSSKLRALDKPIENNHVIALNVIIPFRDEIQNLPFLLEYLIEHRDEIQRLNHLIFVNDHSSDNGDKLVEEFIREIPFENVSLIHNAKGEHGKKRAIYNGIQFKKGDYVLTLDADSLPVDGWLDNWQEILEKNVKVYLGGVRIEEQNTFWNKIQRIENSLTQFLTASTTVLQRPVMANGTHLCYPHSLMNHDKSFNYQVLSGDDADVLLEAKKFDYAFQYHVSEKIRVTTKVPDSASEFYNQKLRWISKVAGQFSRDAVLGIGFLFMRLFVFLYAIFSFEPPSLLFVSLIMFLEYQIVAAFHKKLNQKSQFGYILMYLLLLPLYTLTLVVGLVFKSKAKWKNRALIQHPIG